MRDFHEALETSDSEGETDDERDPWEDQRPAKKLVTLENLQQVTLVAFEDWEVDFN
jgi:hypothetical protein